MPGLTFIQGGTAAAGSSNVPYTLAGAVKGDLVFVATSNFFSVHQITDSWGTVYAPLQSATNGVTVGALYWGTVFADGDTTITAQFTGDSTPSIAILEFRKVGTLTSDGGATNTGLSVTSLATGSIGLTGNDLVIAMLSTTVGSIGIPSGYTAGPAFGPSGPTYGTATAYLLGGNGSTNPTWTQSSGNAVAAVYAFSLVYQPATLPVPYISKCGQGFCLGAVANTTSSSSIGTVSIASGSASLATTSPQAGVIGWPIMIAGDSSSGTYTIIGGSGRDFTVTPVYGGSSDAVGAVATIAQNHPAAPITAINSDPTISVQFGGTGSAQQVEIAGPFDGVESGGLAFAFWQLLCGAVQQAITQTPGSNYSPSPTIAASNVTGTGPTLGAPVVSPGVTGFTGLVGGSNYTSATKVTIGVPSITLAATLTTGSTAATVGSTMGLYPGISVLGSGPNPNVILSITSSTAFTLAYAATVSGSHTLTLLGKQPMATPTIVDGVITAVVPFVPGTLCILNSPPAATITDTGGGTGGSVTAVVSRAIAYCPVLTPGSKNTGPVTLTVSDADGSGAVVAALMSGVAPADVPSYSADDAWYSIAAGTAPPTSFSGSAVANYSGVLEPGFGGLLGFNRPPNQQLLKLGYCVPGPENASYFASFFATANWWKRAAQMSHVQSFAFDQRPLTVDGTAESPCSFGVSDTVGNNVDGNSYPGPVGVWTQQVDDTDPSSPLNLSMTSATFAADVATVFTEGLATTGLASITQGSGGSGYTACPKVVVVGNGSLASAYCLICNGSVIGTYILSTGRDYTGTITLQYVGGGGTGAASTATVGPVLFGRTWQWTVARNGTADNLGLQLNAWKTTGGTYPYTATYECLSDPATTAAALPNLPSRSTRNSLGGSTAASLTTASKRYPYALRWMDATCGEDGWCNLVDGEDLKNPDAWTYYYDYNFAGSGSSAPTRSRQINVTAIRTYSISHTGLAWCTVADGGTGYGSGTTATVTDAGGGTGGTVSLVIAGGVITGAYVQITGKNYVTPLIALSNTGGGSGASITVTVGYPSGWSVTSDSDKIFYPGTYAGVTLTPTPDWAGYGSGSLGGPYYRTPGNISYLSSGGQTQTTQNFAGELVTSAPHDCKYGQQVYYDGSGSGTFSQSNGLGAVTTGQSLPGGFTWPMFPTGPNTLAFLFEGNTNPTGGSGPGLPGGINNVAGSFTVDYTMDVYVPDGASSDLIPFEVAAQATGSLPGCNLWANINHAMTDAGVGAEAAVIRDNFPKGDTVFLEMSNEVWSSEVPNAFFSASAQLGMWGDEAISGYVVRTSAAQDIFVATFNQEDVNGNTNRGGEIFRLIGSQGSADAGVTGTVINAANLRQLPFAGVHMSDYVDIPTDASIVQMAALLATHWPISPEYQAANPISREFYCDWLRHHLMYNISSSSNAGLAGYINQQTVINTYDVTIDAVQLPIPIICCYEGSLERIVAYGLGAAGADPTGNSLYNQVVHDLYYAPPIYGVEDALYWSLQQYGISFIMLEDAGGEFSEALNVVWSHTAWSGEASGLGDGSIASNGVAVTNVFWADTQAAHHDTNVAVLNRAFLDRISNGPSLTPAAYTVGPRLCMLADANSSQYTIGPRLCMLADTDTTTYSIDPRRAVLAH